MKRCTFLLIVFALSFRSLLASPEKGDRGNVDRIRIYPNPSAENIEVSFTLPEAGTVEVLICDLNGKVILTESRPFPVSGEHMMHLSLGYLPSGIYFVKVRSGKYSAYDKLLITN